MHAGVIATMVDHTGYSAYAVVSRDICILTVELKINYFRIATGEANICRSRVINRGRKIIVSESEISSLSGERGNKWNF